MGISGLSTDIPEVNRLVGQIAEKAVGVYICTCIDTYTYENIYMYIYIYIYVYVFIYIRYT
jgi:hypothetical protein